MILSNVSGANDVGVEMRESCVLSKLRSVWHATPAVFAENQARGTSPRYSPADKFAKETGGLQPKLPSDRRPR